LDGKNGGKNQVFYLVVAQEQKLDFISPHDQELDVILYVGSVIKNLNLPRISLLAAATSKSGLFSSKLMPQWSEQPHRQALLKNGGAKFMPVFQRFRELKLSSWLPILLEHLERARTKGVSR
jgi:hypothetical protein